MSTKIENKIISLLQQKDKQAISLLYEHYSDALFGVILKIVKRDEIAEDVLQESFIKIWKNSQSYDSKKAKLFTWLFRIVRNTSIDKLRSIANKSAKNVQIDTTNVYKITSKGLNEDVLDIKKHINTLEEKYQVVLQALFFEGITQQEASEELDIPLGTIKSRLKIALRELKKIYIN